MRSKIFGILCNNILRTGIKECLKQPRHLGYPNQQTVKCNQVIAVLYNTELLCSSQVGTDFADLQFHSRCANRCKFACETVKLVLHSSNMQLRPTTPHLETTDVPYKHSVKVMVQSVLY